VEWQACAVQLQLAMLRPLSHIGHALISAVASSITPAELKGPAPSTRLITCKCKEALQSLSERYQIHTQNTLRSLSEPSQIHTQNTLDSMSAVKKTDLQEE
jgi:hypothetical protein